MIGGQPAWRALPSGPGGALDALSNTMKSFMQTPVLTPASAASDLVKASTDMVKLAAECALAGSPGVVGTAASQVLTLNTTNVALTATWTAASAAPGGQPAANTAYTEGIKATAAAAASAVVSAMNGMADTHICPVPCPIPPHGPGMVTKGATNVMINGLPAARKGDNVMEACGGADPISVGLPTVDIGDGGGGGGGGGAGGAGAAAGAGAGGAAGAAAGAAAAGGAAAPTNGPYATADDAARAALDEANPQSIRDNLEYGGVIYQGADGQYYYSGPARGTDQGFDPASAPAPAGTTVVGDYHTHGDYSVADPATGAAIRTSDPTRDDFNSDNFSGADRRGIAADGAGTPGYAGYLGTPSGTYRRYDPATGADTVL